MYNEIINIMLRLFSQFVDGKENFERNEGIYFKVKVDGTNHGFENDGNTHHDEWECRVIKYFHIIFLKNKNVFVSISEDEKLPIASEIASNWINTSNHNYGTHDLIDLYFKINYKIFENTPPEHQEAPIMGNVKLSLQHGYFSGPVFKFVKVKKKLLADGYHSSLTKIELVHKSITV